MVFSFSVLLGEFLGEFIIQFPYYMPTNTRIVKFRIAFMIKDIIVITMLFYFAFNET